MSDTPTEYIEYFAARRWNVPAVELVSIDWRLSDGVVWYSNKKPEQSLHFGKLAERDIVTDTRLVGGHFRTVPRTFDLADESVTLKFWDADRAITTLYQTNGPGVRVEVFSYYPDIDWLKSEWWGHLKRPEKADGLHFDTKAESGFRSGSIQIPHGAFYTSCSAVFSGLRTTQAAIDDSPCPYNRQIGGAVGNLDTSGRPFTSCPKTRTACIARLGDDLSFYGFQTVTSTHVVSQSQGPNLSASTSGNETNLKDPPAVAAGHIKRRDLPVLAFTPEPNTAHPDEAALRALFHLSVGPIEAGTLTKINGRFPQSSTVAPTTPPDPADGPQVGSTQVRLGKYRQNKTTFSAQVANYSGQAIAYGVDHPGDYRNTTGANINGEAEIFGLNNVRIFNNDGTFARAYDTNRARWLMHLYLEHWGMRYPLSRFNLASWIAVEDWCDGQVLSCDATGPIPITRSTFHQLITKRNARDQIYDLCVSGFIGLPFVKDGLLELRHLGRVDNLDECPVFTDEGQWRNITKASSGISSLEYKEIKAPTAIKLTFEDAALDWTEYSILIQDDVAALAEGRALGDDSAVPDEKSFTAFGVKNLPEAMRLGNLLLALGPLAEGGLENPLEITFTTWSLLAESIGLAPGDVIKVLSKKLVGFGERTTKRQFEYFRVKKMERADNLTLKITAQAYPVDYYDLTESETTPLPCEVEAPIPSPPTPDNAPLGDWGG
jgi:hypothetical protein